MVISIHTEVFIATLFSVKSLLRRFFRSSCFFCYLRQDSWEITQERGRIAPGEYGRHFPTAAGSPPLPERQLPSPPVGEGGLKITHPIDPLHPPRTFARGWAVMASPPCDSTWHRAIPPHQHKPNRTVEGRFPSRSSASTQRVMLDTRCLGNGRKGSRPLRGTSTS